MTQQERTSIDGCLGLIIIVLVTLLIGVFIGRLI